MPIDKIAIDGVASALGSTFHDATGIWSVNCWNFQRAYLRTSVIKQ
jgi:hypothetical protein